MVQQSQNGTIGFIIWITIIVLIVTVTCCWWIYTAKNKKFKVVLSVALIIGLFEYVFDVLHWLGVL